MRVKKRVESKVEFRVQVQSQAKIEGRIQGGGNGHGVYAVGEDGEGVGNPLPLLPGDVNMPKGMVGLCCRENGEGVGNPLPLLPGDVTEQMKRDHVGEGGGGREAEWKVKNLGAIKVLNVGFRV